MLYDSADSLSASDPSTQHSESILLKQNATLSKTSASSSLAQKQKFIHFIQEKHFRLPHLVVKYGTHLLKHAAGRLGNAVWDMYERVFISALDSSDSRTARWCLAALDGRWSSTNSRRLRRLHAMELESRGMYDEAETIYAELLEADPTNIQTLKRLVAVRKAAGDVSGAIARLNAYLRTFPSDDKAWMELAEMYLSISAFEAASFALEEVLLLSPEDYRIHLKYAEVCYTLERMDRARQYYAQSLELKPKNNLRALYGLMLTLRTKGSNTGGGTASNSTSADHDQKLYEWSGEQLLAHYKKFQPDLLPIVKRSAPINMDMPASTTTTTSKKAASTPSASSSSDSDQDASTSSSTSTSSSAAVEQKEPSAAELPD